MVFRVYVEKKSGLDLEAAALKEELTVTFGIGSVEGVRVINRYDAENISEELFREAVRTVFSEPQLDDVSYSLPEGAGEVFAVEYLPGQFDQRADSAAQCIQILSCGERPVIRTARVYVISGRISADDMAKIKKFLINPVESREASLELPSTLVTEYTRPADVAVLDGFRKLSPGQIGEFIRDYGLAMDADDLEFCRRYFEKEGRDPTLTEIRMIDTYWSDHCRHTTFLTTIDSVVCPDGRVKKAYEDYLAVRRSLGRDKKPVNLMDIATAGVRYLKCKGLLPKLDESEEINACTVKITVEADGKKEPWLLLFKNETHNHPTEIEPFGGAATCIGGAIRDPLSGRSYVYAAMRVTGAADPTRPVSETLPGKLPQRKIVRTAAAGYSSYGNQIGLATGQVSEIYHPGYAAKRMEIGAVIAAAPAASVRRERPVPGDIVILLGGRTGRDGIGGATGSSKAHNLRSVETCGAEVQKGNAPEERKLQRLFRNPEASLMIKRCNDFGAGGVSVAIGELADGLLVDLDRVPRKYEGLDGTELAISESQERMAVVVDPENADRFIELASGENLEATPVATVTAEPRLRMTWRGKTIVDVSREFLGSNGAEKHVSVNAAPAASWKKEIPEGGSFADSMKALLSDLNCSSGRGLSQRFDSTIGAGTVLMPFGGRYQRTPAQAMVHLIPCEKKHTDDASFMAWGFNPFVTEKSPYHGAYLAVVESISRLIASGASFSDVYLTFQEYFEKLGKDPDRWGKPFSALLGALKAQLDFGVASIGGKDSMSGSFEDLHVPPTLVSFAVTTGKTADAISPEFKKAGRRVALISPEYAGDGLPDPDSQKAVFGRVTSLMREGRIFAASTPSSGGIAEGVYRMCIGNRVGFRYADGFTQEDLFGYSYGSFIVETDSEDIGRTLGYTTVEESITFGGEKVSLDLLDRIYEERLENVYPTLEKPEGGRRLEAFSFEPAQRKAPSVISPRPTVLIPVFPGTNCEYDSAKAFEDAGARTQIFVINNLTPEGISSSAERFAKEIAKSQIVFIPGGFSGGDEPDGSAKFIMSFMRNKLVKEEINRLVGEREGLMLGICNGFQALIKLGLLQYGRITETGPDDATLTYNRIARHQSGIVRVRIASTLSPWLAGFRPGDIQSVPISHGEGRFYASDKLVRELAARGQIATQYAGPDGLPTDDIRYNPNGSAFAIEGITSPDGRVFGRMGHSERNRKGLYKNVPGDYNNDIFASAVRYFA